MSNETLSTEEYLQIINEDNLLSDETYLRIFEFDTPLEKTKYITALKVKAKRLSLSKEFDNLLKSWQAEYVSKVKRFDGGNLIDFTDCPVSGLSCGKWTANDFGVIKREITGFGQNTTIEACSHPIVPIERLYNIDTETEKVKLAFFKDKRWQTVTVDRSVCADKGTIVRNLANRGIEVTSKNSAFLVEYIADVIKENKQNIPVYLSASRIGWINDSFSPYDDKIKFDAENDFRGIYDAVKSKGDFKKWIDFVHTLRSESLLLRLQMATAFASPLIEKVNALPFIFHLYGGTGAGKTVGLMVAMSIWGDPTMGRLVRTMNMTANNMVLISSFLNSIPLAADELQQIKSNWDNNYDKIVMFLCEGIDRGRNTSRSNTERLKTWHNSFLFTGEDALTKSNSGGGVKNRVIEAEVDAPVVKNGNEVVNFIKQNYGHAGPVYIQYLKDHISELNDRYNSIFKDIISKYDTTEKQAMAMSLMLLADEISIECFFKDEEKINTDDIKQYLSSTKEVDAADRAYEWTLNWLSKNQNRFSEENPNGEFWGKIDAAENIAIVNKTVYQDELSKAGFDYTIICKTLATRKKLIKNTQGKFVHQTKVFGIKASYIKIAIDTLEAELNEDMELPF